MIYLDNSSTTKEYDEVRSLIYNMSGNSFGNASSLHSLGFKAHNELENARKEIGKYFSEDGDIIFTSGGTESDNMAIFSSCMKMRKRANKIITSHIEHPAVLNTCKNLENYGFELIKIENDDRGIFSLESLKDNLDKDVCLVTLMTVNNEVGTIEPISEISEIIRNFNKENGTDIIFHTDAVQAFGKIKLDKSLFDLASVSGHKIHAPKGIGALYMDKKLRLMPLLNGGGQESGFRSGTENIPAIAGFALASKLTHENLSNNQAKLSKLNEYFIRRLSEEICDYSINGVSDLGFSLDDSGLRLPNILSISFHGTRGEVILHILEQDEIYVSTGSACSSHNNSDSHVLKAMNKNHKEIEGTLRFSFSEFNTIDDMNIVIDRLKLAINRFRKLGSFR